MLTSVGTLISVRSFSRRVALVAACLTTAPFVAEAQSDSERVIWRSLLGGTAFDVRAKIPGLVRLGLADDAGPMTLEFRASDTRRFADSATKLIGVRRRRPRAWSVRVEEAGARSGGMSLSFTPGPDSTRPYLFFASDDAVRQVREPLTAAEASLVIRRIRTAAVTATPRPAPSSRPNARRPKPG